MCVAYEDSVFFYRLSPHGRVNHYFLFAVAAFCPNRIMLDIDMDTGNL